MTASAREASAASRDGFGEGQPDVPPAGEGIVEANRRRPHDLNPWAGKTAPRHSRGAGTTSAPGQPQLFFDVTAYTVVQIRSTLVLPQ